VNDQHLLQFRQILDSAGERAALAFLAQLSRFRYLSIIYYVEGRGHPVHHFDRQNPDLIEAEELDQQLTYCSTVIVERRPVVIADSLAEQSLKAHPAREHIRSYYGLPLLAEDGSAHAVLCHYDHVPQDIAALDHDLLRQAALEFQARLARYGANRVASTVETVYTEVIGNSTFHVVKHTKAEWARPRYSVERTRTRADGTVTPRVAYGQSTAFGQGGFSSVEDAMEFGREWCAACAPT
jgi:hypothetical protein